MTTTYGVTSVEVGYRFSDIAVGVDNNVTADGLNYLIGLAADELNGILERVGIDTADITAGTILYSNCQRLTLTLLGPMLQEAAHGQVATAAELADIREEVRAQLELLKRQPRDLGDVAETVEPRVMTSTSLQDVTTSSRLFASGPNNPWRD